MPQPDETAITAWLAAMLHELAEPTDAAMLSLARAAEQLDTAHKSLRTVAFHIDALRWLLLILRQDPAETPVCISAPSLAESLDVASPSRADLWVDVPAHLALFAAPGCLELVLSNLLAHARKHARRALISVRATCADAIEVHWPQDSPHRLTGRVILLTVAQDGTGVADGCRLFEPFAAAGGDIGLWLCRRIVRAHGGDLWFDSTERGASFTSVWKEAALPQPGHLQQKPEMQGQTMREARTALGLTRAQLASLSGVADSTIRNFEMNRNRPTAATLRALTDALAKAASPDGKRHLDPTNRKGRPS